MSGDADMAPDDIEDIPPAQAASKAAVTAAADATTMSGREDERGMAIPCDCEGVPRAGTRRGRRRPD
jgi:hypothetical protein